MSPLPPSTSPGVPVLNQTLVKVLSALVALAGLVVALPSMGIALPVWAQPIAAAIVSIGAAFGILSPGARKVDDAVKGANAAAAVAISDKASAVAELK